MDAVTEYLADGYAGDLTTLGALQILCGFSHEQAAAACLVSPATYRRWRSDRKANPTAVRLMAIHAGYFPWPGWDGWEMHNGFLFPPGYARHGFGPGNLMALPFLYQLLAEYRRKGKSAETVKPTLDRLAEGARYL
ncbi:hypothetical protein TspCOW1_07870 [Thiohalobacter sp. COW1]|uniref:hypothetical protein n=1 Tax=Thiohalobacter sp. COW1 TaxID=2795687 RepID=UPI0019168B9B|nr:hypothetical protein [Thiohalobacter sp. COW1]BCO30682.1 hypothetical protein TspCOW1_07850 [Thiohalobacter sp. COW1]BCO30684.1 hypothetical protein TspCOW1_07870 [Thiohalobacter sp. COW1]